MGALQNYKEGKTMMIDRRSRMFVKAVEPYKTRIYKSMDNVIYTLEKIIPVKTRMNEIKEKHPVDREYIKIEEWQRLRKKLEKLRNSNLKSLRFIKRAEKREVLLYRKTRDVFKKPYPITVSKKPKSKS